MQDETLLFTNNYPLSKLYETYVKIFEFENFEKVLLKFMRNNVNKHIEKLYLQILKEDFPFNN